MISRFDIDQPKSSTLEFPKDDLDKIVPNLKNGPENAQLQQDSRLRSDRATNDFLVRDVYNNVEYAPVSLPVATSNVIWSRQNVSLYQEADSRLNGLETPYFCGMPARSVVDARRELPDFCSVGSVANELRIPREFCADGGRSSMAEMKILEACSNTFGAVNNRDLGDSYLRTMNVFDRIPSPENGVSATDDAFGDAYVLGETQESVCGQVSLSPVEEIGDNLSDTVSEDETAANSAPSVENKDSNEVSDLRDRVNSVTALYNIVESELDERKKKIIRNYVDNMFRVLQYRYNKCKTKKRTSGKRNQQSSSHRRLGRLSGNIPRKPRGNTRQKMKTSNQRLVSSSFPAVHNSSKSTNSYQNSLDDPIIDNLKSDLNIMRWDQY